MVCLSVDGLLANLGDGLSALIFFYGLPLTKNPWPNYPVRFARLNRGCFLPGLARDAGGESLSEFDGLGTSR